MEFVTRRAISSRQESPASYIDWDEVTDAVEQEIGKNAWMFPAAQVAKMLSPKRPKRPNADTVPYPLLQDFELLIEQPSVKEVIESLKAPPKLQRSTLREGDNYPEFAQFLNSCIDHCDDAYNAIEAAPSSSKGPFTVAPIAKRWLPKLHFNPYDKPTKERATSLSPHLGGRERKDVRFCYWSLPLTAISEAEIAEEVNNSWPDLVVQAAMDARVQDHSIPLRTFSVVVAVNSADYTLRFLIFHRGGLSASSSLDLTHHADCLMVQKVMLSVLLWQTPQDAGIPSFTDGMTFLLPSSHGSPVRTVVTKALYHAPSMCGRNTWVGQLETIHEPQIRQSATSTTHTLCSAVTAARIKRATVHGHPLTFPAAKSKGRKTVLNLDQDELCEALTQTVAKAFCTIDARPFFVPPRCVIPQEYVGLDQESRVFVVKCSWPNTAKREVEPKFYQACRGQFGTPRHLLSFEACYMPGFVMSNSIFLPHDLANGVEWHIWEDVAPEKPNPAEVRSLWVTLLGDEGSSFENCTDSCDLCECLLHAMLGWLVAYQNGYLHRDVSIGNLLKLRVPKECDRFTTKGVLQLLKSEGVLNTDTASITDGFTHLTLNDWKPADDEKFWDTLKRAAEGDQSVTEVVEIAHELDRAFDEYGVSAECKAIICDGDMAASIPEYFEDRKYGDDISGTPEFMSLELRDATALKYPCLQTPVDDMHSFFWVALWAILHPSGSQTEREGRLRKMIEGSRHDRQGAAANLSNIVISRYGHLLVVMAPLLRDWYASLDRLQYECLQIWEKARSDMDSRQKRLLFHRFAYRGVADFVAVLAKHSTVSKATPTPGSST